MPLISAHVCIFGRRQFISLPIGLYLLLSAHPLHSHPFSPFPLRSGYFLTSILWALPLSITILLSASSRTFPVSISAPLSSLRRPGKSSFPVFPPPPAPQQTSMEWSDAGRWGQNTVSRGRRGSGLLIPQLWVEEVEVSFDYVTSTQPLHPDDAVQPARLALPGPNGERFSSAQLTTVPSGTGMGPASLA